MKGTLGGFQVFAGGHSAREHLGTVERDKFGLGVGECARRPEQPVGPAHPCSGKVCSRAVVIGHIRKEEVTQMPLAEDDDMVKKFPFDRANQSFRMAILPWRSRRGRPITNASLVRRLTRITSANPSPFTSWKKICLAESFLICEV